MSSVSGGQQQTIVGKSHIITPGAAGAPPTPFTWSGNFGDNTVVGNGWYNFFMFA